jgi:hypothetical protein
VSRAKIKAAFREAGLRPSQFADIVGLSRTMVARLCLGYAPVPAWMLAVVRLCAAAPKSALAEILRDARGNERWKQVVRFPDYEVSDRGRVRRAVPADRTYYVGVMKQKMRDGYPTVQLYDGKRQVNCAVHRLVALSFCNRKAGKDTVCHRDGIRTHNRPKNLYWGDAADNAADRKKHARAARLAAIRAKSGQTSAPLELTS